MSLSHVDRAYARARRVAFDDYARFVFISDCHRGYGGWADGFAVNQTSYFAALTHYNRNGYTYFELGDGDELWENRSFAEISAVHNHVFWLLRRFYEDGRLYMLYGNHDMEKRAKPGLMDAYYDATETRSMPLFPGMPVYESIVLRHRVTGFEVFLLHGHQADYLNDNLWALSRFLVRHVWKPLQLVGMKDPSAATINDRKKQSVEKRLMDWSDREGKLMIAGHTHRPVFPSPGQTRYFNDGSCVHPRCLTAIELAGGVITLVKWSTKARQDGTLYVGRDVLAGPTRLRAYGGN
jgi:UDP-2,3-diacylglucosamine pyrophosphatase LpxH